MQEVQFDQIRRTIKRIWSKKWLYLVPGVLACVGATAFAISQPNEYRGEAVLIAEFSTTGGGSVRISEVDRTREVLRSVQERIYSDEFLLPMMEETGVYQDLIADGKTEAAIEAARKGIAVVVTDTNGVVRVTFDYSRGDDASQKAAIVANYVAKYVVEKARSSITRDSTALRNFYAKEAAETEQRVEALRRELIAFRSANEGILPENRATNQAQVNSEEQTIRLIAVREDSLRLEVSDLEGDLELARRGLYEAKVKAGADEDLEPRRAVLLGLRRELAEMERKYIPTAWQIVAMKKRIEVLEAEVEAMEKKGVANSSEDDPLVQYALNRVKRVESQLQRKSDELKNIDQVIVDSRKAIAAAKERISRSLELQPVYQKLEESLVHATKAWEAAKREHDAAELTLRFHTDTEEFALHINQQAQPKKQPVGPKRLALSLLGLFGGIGAGLAVTVLLIRMDASVRSRSDLKPLLPAAILVSIPNIESRGRVVGRAIGHFLLGSCLAILFAGAIGALGVREGWWGDAEAMSKLFEGILQGRLR